MRSADIKATLDSDRRVYWAVLVPVFRFGRYAGREIVKARIASAEGHRVLLDAHPTETCPNTVVQPAAVLTTWEAHLSSLLRDADQRQRAREREQAEHDARKAEVEAVLPVFAGIMVPAQGSGPPEDAADVLRETFCKGGAAGATFSRGFFVALGRGLAQRQTIEVD